MIFAFLVAILFSGSTATAREPAPPAYQRLVDQVSSLYLEPNEITPADLLAKAADDLSDRIDWLIIDVDGGRVSLRDGDGEHLGDVEVTNWDDLADALYGLEEAVRIAGHEIGDIDIRHATLDGATEALDRYSSVLAGDGLTRFDTRLKGTLVGIGASLGLRDERLKVLSVFPDGPAKLGGMLADDWIVRIDGQSTTHMPVQEAVRRIRGEAGTPIVFDLMRPTPQGDRAITLKLKRASVVLPNVEQDVLEGKVGYVRIDHISQKTVYNLRHALQELATLGALDHGLVMDLRGNSGGSMKESAAVVDLFVEEGLLLLTVGHDGGPVPNLAHRIDASADSDDNPRPLVVLVDRKTASGAEIISGSLLALDRAVVLGQRTYGKGLVQKIYPLDNQASLKLTVAEYVLEHNLRVRPDGIAPDVTFGQIVLRDRGVRYEDGWDVERERTSWDDIIPIVDEREDWRGTSRDPGDVVLEVARRAILTTEDPGDRASVLAAVQRLLPGVRRTEEQHLAAALEARGIDWRAAPGPGAQPEARVKVTAKVDPTDPNTYELRADVLNHGPTTLYRTIVRLTCAEFGWWDDLVIPVGAIASGAKGSGTVRVTLAQGVLPRRDIVGVELRAHRRPALHLPDQVLPAGSTPEPALRVTAELQGTGPDRIALLHVTNLSPIALEGVEAEFAYPSDLDVELTDHAVRRPLLPAGGKVSFELGMRVGTDLPRVLPMRLRLEADGWGRLVSWELPLPTNGSPVTVEAPDISVQLGPTLQAGNLRAPLTVTDDGTLTSIVVFLNGDKVLWHPGGSHRVELAPAVAFVEGPNRLSIRARDEQGVVVQRTWTILGTSGEGIANDGPSAP